VTKDGLTECDFGPFYIFPFTDHPDDKSILHNGWHIELKDQEDVHWALQWEMTVFEAFQLGENQVMVKMPSMSFTYLKSRTANAEDDAKSTLGYNHEQF
jgi:hypothetical protein